MSEPLLRDWLDGDCAALDLREPDRTDARGVDLDAMARGLAGEVVIRRTLCHDGRPVAVFGAVLVGGVAGIWALTSDEAARHPVTLCRELRNLLAELFTAGAHRVEALVHPDNLTSYRWLTRIGGMRFEGYLRQSGANRTDRLLLANVLPKEGREGV